MLKLMERGDTERFEQLFQQIYEIASGNFAYRNKLSGRRDHLDTLAELLNMMSEEIASFSYELIPQTPTPANLQILLFSLSWYLKGDLGPSQIGLRRVSEPRNIFWT